MKVSEFLKAYMNNSLGKKTREGNWKVINWGHMDTLQYWPEDFPGQYENIAYRLPTGEVILNGNRLNYVGRVFAWGNESRWATSNNQSRIQRYLEQLGAISIPFTLFDETDLDVRDFEWVHKPVGETITVRVERGYKNFVDVQRHFSGACVFKIGDKYYLFDVDRKELEENKVFNAFIVELPEPVDNVIEAYEALRPREVSDAIESGVDVKRQGEFFFIKVGDECPVKANLTLEEIQVLRFPPSRYGFGISKEDRTDLLWLKDDVKPYQPEDTLTPIMEEFQRAALAYREVRNKYDGSVSKEMKLDSTISSSHSCDKCVSDGTNTYASGTVKQSRREHIDLILQGWYKVVPNRAVKSITIRGEID